VVLNSKGLEVETLKGLEELKDGEIN